MTHRKEYFVVENMYYNKKPYPDWHYSLDVFICDYKNLKDKNYHNLSIKKVNHIIYILYIILLSCSIWYPMQKPLIKKHVIPNKVFKYIY
jgi:hypothetical protein